MKILLILATLAVYFDRTMADGEHPHGKSVSLYEMKMINGQPNISIQYEDLDKMLNHPDVKDRKIVVFTILGALRKGKSFFLDYCLRYLYANYESINTKGNFQKNTNWMGDANEPLKGFSWRSGSVAMTKGVLVWNDVFLTERNGEKLAIIIIDTQGLFEMGSTVQSDARIFGLATLFSSIQAINMMGVVQEDQLQYLEMATDFTKLVTKQTKKSQKKPFQNLLFLIRDWDDEDVGLGYSGGSNYVQTIFNLVTENKAAQNVRDNIRKAYDNIDCFLLPHPGLIVKKKAFTGAWKDLDQAFLTNLKVLIESIFAPKNLKTKKIFMDEITASEFNSYVTTYMKIYQSNDLPQVDFIYQSAAEKQLVKLIFESSEFYQKKINEIIDYNRNNFEQALQTDHEMVRAMAVNKFLETEKMGDDEIIEKSKEALIAEIDNFFTKWKPTIMRNYEQVRQNKISAENAKKQNEEMSRQLHAKELENALLKERQSTPEKPWYKKFVNGGCNIISLGFWDCM